MSFESLYKITDCSKCGKELTFQDDRKVYVMARELEIYMTHATYGYRVAKETGYIDVVCEDCKNKIIKGDKK
jgi:DNA-directed RNA polymerase subunit RPC12/RpoP